MQGNKFVYLIKVQGKSRIPDYVQLRDQNYTLIAYFRADRPEKALAKCGLAEQSEELRAVIDALPFGKMHKIELK